MPNQIYHDAPDSAYATLTDIQILRLLTDHTQVSMDPALANEIRARFIRKDESISFWVTRVNDLVRRNFGMDHKTATELMRAKEAGRILDHIPGEKVWDRHGQEWVITSSEMRFVNGELRQLYRCGHPGTCDYCTLFESEVREGPLERKEE